MLRRKLMLILGSLVATLLVAAVAAIMLLQSVLEDLDHLSTAAVAGTNQTGRLGATINRIEAELTELRLRGSGHLDSLIDAVELLHQQVDELGGFYLVDSDAAAPFSHLRDQLPIFTQYVGDLATTQDPELAAVYAEVALHSSVRMREQIALLGEIFQEHMQVEQREVTARFRWIVLGVAIVFLLVINISLVVLLRAGTLVLRPVDRLVEASRRLAQEEFDHRVELPQDDEFGELARAYNSLAAQLQRNEERKLETLHHAARTLNHELNNAISIIELQLRMLARNSDRSEAMEKPLRQIHEALGRMARTTEALLRTRRIVLTDYLEGMKMLDLERSTEDGPGDGLFQRKAAERAQRP